MTKKQVKEQVEQSMAENNLVIMNKQDALTAIEFIRDLILISVDETKANEPYATQSIKRMMDAFSEVGNLTDLIELVEE